MTASESWPPWATERVVVVPHDPGWRSRAAHHTARLQLLLAPWLVRPVEHVGSTAVPDLTAKPIIDLQAAVPDLGVTARITEALRPAGWHLVPVELDRRPWRRLYVLPDGGVRAAHLHLMTDVTPRWREQITFRDALRADPDLVAEYARIKADLAARHADDREAYSRAKASFVHRVVHPALTLHRELPAPPSAVFDAWTTPSTMRQWLFAGDTGEIIDVTADPRPGGRYSILERRADGEVDHHGTDTAVRRPHHLAFSLHVPRHFAERTTITVDIEPAGGGSRLTFTQRGIDPDTTRPFWDDMLDTLGRCLERSST